MIRNCKTCCGTGIVHDPACSRWKFWRVVPCPECGGRYGYQPRPPAERPVYSPHSRKRAPSQKRIISEGIGCKREVKEDRVKVKLISLHNETTGADCIVSVHLNDHVPVLCALDIGDEATFVKMREVDDR